MPEPAETEVQQILVAFARDQRAWTSGPYGEEFVQAKHRAIEELARLGERAVGPLIAHVEQLSWPEDVGLTDEDICLAALVDLGSPAALDYVFECVDRLVEAAAKRGIDGDTRTRGLAAIEALGRSRRPEVLAQLRAWVDRIKLEWDGILISHLLYVTGPHLLPDSLPLLLRLVQHRDIEVSKTAASALVAIGPPAVSPLVALVTDSLDSHGSTEGLGPALRVLAATGGAEALPLLNRFADGSGVSPWARWGAAYYLERASDSNSAEAWDRAASRVLGPGKTYGDIEAAYLAWRNDRQRPLN